MVKIHDNSVDGDIDGGVFEEVKPEQIRLAQEQASLDYNQALIENTYRTLPSRQQADANINFLGSSYSGSDIKVVAHLYDEVEWSDKKLEELNEKLSVAQTIVEGCDSLISGGLASLQAEGDATADYSTKKDAFIAAAVGAITSPEKQKAADVLTNSVFKASNFSFHYLAIARMKRVTEAIKTRYESELKEYQQRVEHLKSIGEKKSSSTVTLATLQTISVQSFREKNAVRALGHTYAKSYTRGTRTIGGSMIFTIFDEHALSQLISKLGQSPHMGGGERDLELSTLLPDQLPPLDLTIIFSNEYGSLSDFRLYGVEFFTDGDVFSIEDLLSEKTMNFVCRDADIMTSRGRIKISRLQRGMFNDKDDKDVNGSSLLFDNDSYNEYLGRLGVRRRLTNR